MFGDRKFVVLLTTVVVMLVGAANAEDTMRLEWVISGQSSGFNIADVKDYYKNQGVDLTILPGGPDIKAAVTVAQGGDDFGVGHPNQIISARAHDVPLVMIMQFGQSSATTYIARKETGIKSVADMPGHSVGLWFGGDEHEFLAMLKSAGVKQSEVEIISQGFSIVPWLENEYDVMQVTVYDELNTVYKNGFSKEDLIFLSPVDYGANMVAGGVFTTEQMIEERPDVVQAVVNASMRGWKEALADPEEAAKVVVELNPEQDYEHTVNEVKAWREIICNGPTLEGKFGFSEYKAWEVSQNVLIGAGLIDGSTDLKRGYTNHFWENAPDEYKTVNCP